MKVSSRFRYAIKVLGKGYYHYDNQGTIYFSNNLFNACYYKNLKRIDADIKRLEKTYNIVCNVVKLKYDITEVSYIVRTTKETH